MRCRRTAVRGDFPNDSATSEEARAGQPRALDRRLCCGRRHAMAVTNSSVGLDSHQHLSDVVDATTSGSMNDSSPGSLVTLAWSFGLMSLFAVGGANSAIPEIHRLAVDVNHWMSDKQFADV